MSLETETKTKVKIIENVVLYHYELNLDDYEELYLPNCIEIIESFWNDNRTIKRIIAPKLMTIIDYFEFIKLKYLIVPEIRHITSCSAIDRINSKKLKVISEDNFSSSYVIDGNYKSDIHRDKIFYNCGIYEPYSWSKFYNCDITLYNLFGRTNEFHDCEVEYLGLTVNSHINSEESRDRGFEKEIVINALKTSKLFNYFKNTNSENLSDDEIINILQSYCISDNIRKIKIKSFDDILNNKDISHDLLYLQCVDLLDMVHFKLNV